jgi:uncharacterized Fe-S cluster protein YjdI
MLSLKKFSAQFQVMFVMNDCNPHSNNGCKGCGELFQAKKAKPWMMMQ